MPPVVCMRCSDKILRQVRWALGAVFLLSGLASLIIVLLALHAVPLLANDFAVARSGQLWIGVEISHPNQKTSIAWRADRRRRAYAVSQPRVCSFRRAGPMIAAIYGISKTVNPT